MPTVPEMLLPADLHAAACRSGNEWGWTPDLIPRVINEAEKLDLLSVGGQLQFLLPAGTCECYWVSVDPLNDEPDGLSWRQRVKLAAERSREQFAALRASVDFLAEGRKAFGHHLSGFEAAGGDPADRMYFIWYLEAELD
jgi:hypothetical protein